MAEQIEKENDKFLLDELERCCQGISFGFPEAPKIVRASGKFVLQRLNPARKPTSCNTLRAALRKVVLEIAMMEKSR